mmetsp:Transcript_3564/g.6845  ORF Transcript_3564/g.6845 Transcript_3564/m.6845 type:complete len:224 (+) Transcript_3564:2164-2835(+)
MYVYGRLDDVHILWASSKGIEKDRYQGNCDPRSLVSQTHVTMHHKVFAPSLAENSDASGLGSTAASDDFSLKNATPSRDILGSKSTNVTRESVSGSSNVSSRDTEKRSSQEKRERRDMHKRRNGFIFRLQVLRMTQEMFCMVSVLLLIVQTYQNLHNRDCRVDLVAYWAFDLFVFMPPMEVYILAVGGMKYIQQAVQGFLRKYSCCSSTTVGPARIALETCFF